MALATLYLETSQAVLPVFTTPRILPGAEEAAVIEGALREGEQGGHWLGKQIAENLPHR